MTRRVSAFLLLALAAGPAHAQLAVGSDVGDRCEPGDPLPRPGLLCAPAFEKVNGEPVAEWEFENGNVLNGRKGDALLTPGCGLIGNLLRKVTPPQQYSHSGILTQDRFEVRHSTAAEKRPADHGIGSPAGAEGIEENILRVGWPGTLTQFTDEALEGQYLSDPQGEVYYFRPFNKTAEQCGSNGDLVPSTLLKPPPSLDFPGSDARTRLEAAADEAKQIDGHYRFYGYTNPAAIIDSPVFPPPGDSTWAEGTVGTVCSAFVWKSMKNAGFTLEGASLETSDVAQGAQVDALTQDGLYVYTPLERYFAGSYLYETIYDQAHKEAGDFGDVFVDAGDDVGNQLVNCFGFDWCGDQTFPPTAGACDFEPRSQESPCWRDHPGTGRAVSPDNLLFWDAAPTGPYGYREDLQYQPAQFVRVYRWRQDAGAGTVQGVVTVDGSPVWGALVVVEGAAQALTGTDPTGHYRLEGIPNGPWTVRACYLGQGMSQAFTSSSGITQTVNLPLAGPCDAAVQQGDWKRRVRITGTVKLIDTEDFGSDEEQTFTIDETLDVELPTSGDPDAATAIVHWDSSCVGGEVKGKIKFEATLDQHDKSVDVRSVMRLYEGSSCQDDDLDAVVTRLVSPAAGATSTLSSNFISEEWNADDRMIVNLSFQNQQAP